MSFDIDISRHNRCLGIKFPASQYKRNTFAALEIKIEIWQCQARCLPQCILVHQNFAVFIFLDNTLRQYIIFKQFHLILLDLRK